MGEPQAKQKLRAWRKRHRLTIRDAAAAIVVNGEPCGVATWHGWEAKGKIPKPDFMAELERLGIAEPNDFYPRPDAGELAMPLQPALL